MRYTLSPMFQEIRGKIGTFVASKNRSGVMLRSLVTPRNTQTAKRSTIRVNFSSYAGIWRSLSQTVKDNWKTAALTYTFYNSLGIAYTPSAYQVFLTLNLRIMQLGLAVITAAQNFSQLSEPSAAYSSISLGTEEFNLEGWTDDDGPNYLVISVSQYLPASSDGLKYPVLYLANNYNNVGTPVNLYSLLVALNGRAPVLGEIIYVETVKVNGTTGQIALLQAETVDVVA